MQRDILFDLRMAKQERGLGLYGIVVRQHGEVIAQHRWRSDDRVLLYSVSKTFTSMAAGIAMDEGHFRLEDKVVDFFPEYVPSNAGAYLKQMTVRDLLCMGSGHAECPITSAQQRGETPQDFIKLFMEAPVVYQPGTHYLYDNGATYMVSAIISKTTGQTTRDYLMPRVFDPLNIYNPQWNSCPKGISEGYSGLFLKTEELSRFGQLLLNMGEWKGRQLIPAEYIKMATSYQIDNTPFGPDPESRQGYGFQVWLNTYPNSYRLDGMYGQFCIVLPDLDAVVAITSHEEYRNIDILRLVWDTLADRLEENK